MLYWLGGDFDTRDRERRELKAAGVARLAWGCGEAGRVRHCLTKLPESSRPMVAVPPSMPETVTACVSGERLASHSSVPLSLS